jgi:hypothetical protein
VIALGVGIGRGSDLLDCGTRERLLVARQGMSASCQRQKQRKEGKEALHTGSYREYGTQELRKLKLRDGFAISFGTSVFEVAKKEDRGEIRNSGTHEWKGFQEIQWISGPVRRSAFGVRRSAFGVKMGS